MTTLDANEQEKRRWLIASAALNSILAAAKLGWGIFSGSAVVLADAIHSISDVLGALIVYFAVRIAPYRSERFPMGLHKVEDLAALFGGIGVAYAGYEVARHGFTADPVDTGVSPWLTVGFVTVMLLVQGVFWFYERRAAKRLRSPGLSTDVANWLGDLGAGSVVLVGIAATGLNIPYAEPVAILAVAALILHSAWEVMRDGLLSLLDASVAEDDRRTALRVIRRHAAVTTVQRMRMRRAGSVLFMTAVFETDESDFERAHHLADHIQADLKQAIPALEHVLLHYEPAKEDPVVVVSLETADGTPPERWNDVARVRATATDAVTPVRDQDGVDHAIAIVLAIISSGATRVHVGPANPPNNVCALLEALGLELER